MHNCEISNLLQTYYTDYKIVYRVIIVTIADSYSRVHMYEQKKTSIYSYYSKM